MSNSAASALDGLIARLASRSDFGEADRQALLDLPWRLRRLKRHEVIVREDDKRQFCCVLVSGFAIRHKAAGNGGRQIFSIHTAGEAIDLPNSMLDVADHNVQMLSDGEAAFVPVQSVRDLTLAHPAVGQAMWLETLIDAAIFREWTLNVGRSDARSRMAHLLCEFAWRLVAERRDGELEFELPMTQEEISDALALTPIDVSRALKTLGREGLIARTDRKIRIVDWQRLSRLGDFDSGYLHLPGTG